MVNLKQFLIKYPKITADSVQILILLLTRSTGEL